VKPPKLAYGIEKVAEMGNSTHLEGMSPVFKRKALLMALEAAGTDVGEVLNDVITRQRALKEYEDAWLEKVSQFEAAQLEQNRLQKAELDRITAQFKARLDASLDEVANWHEGLREWQKSKQQELQRLTDAAALCVPHEAGEEEEDGARVTVMAQRAGGAYR
jgi:peptidoglycan hydrolase CwlO-like protein